MKGTLRERERAIWPSDTLSKGPRQLNRWEIRLGDRLMANAHTHSIDNDVISCFSSLPPFFFYFFGFRLTLDKTYFRCVTYLCTHWKTSKWNELCTKQLQSQDFGGKLLRIWILLNFLFNEEFWKPMASQKSPYIYADMLNNSRSIDRQGRANDNSYSTISRWISKQLSTVCGSMVEKVNEFLVFRFWAYYLRHKR